MRSLHIVDIQYAGVTYSDIEVLSELRQLRALTIESCQNVTRLAPFKDHQSLQTTEVNCCCNTQRIAVLTAIPALGKANVAEGKVDADVMSRCVRGFKDPERLELYILIIADVLTVSMDEFRNLRSLSLRCATLKNFEWIAKAPYLTYLGLPLTKITEKDLTEVCGSLYYLEELAIQYCMCLKTSLSLLLPMERIKEVRIPNSGLMNDNVTDILRERGVKIEQY